MKRIVILVPEEIHDAMIRAGEQRYESVSNIGRRLFIEWLIENDYLPPIKNSTNSNDDDES